MPLISEDQLRRALNTVELQYEWEREPYVPDVLTDVVLHLSFILEEEGHLNKVERFGFVYDMRSIEPDSLNGKD